MSLVRRFSGALLSAVLGATLIGTPGAHAAVDQSHALYRLSLPGGATALVYPSGVVHVFSKDRTKVMTRVLPPQPALAPDATRGAVLDRSFALRELLKGTPRPFEPGRVLVVFRD